MSEISEALRGPWVAVIVDGFGDVLDSPDDVDENDEVDVTVVRGTAAPVDGRMPGGYQSGDVLYELSDLCDDEEETDLSIGLSARWEQAQAVANALNALAGSSSGATP